MTLHPSAMATIIDKIMDWVNWGTDMYETIMKATLRFPFARLDRKQYLQNALKKHLSDDEIQTAINSDPTRLLTSEQLDKLAQKEYRKNIRLTTFISFLTALPTNWMMWPCIVLDLIQFQIHVFIISQKLLFLYGKDEETAPNADEQEKANRLMLIISTIMIGKQKLSRMAKSAAGIITKKIIERYAVRVLSKFVIFNFIRQTAKWMGISITKTMLINGINLLIPIACAAISALVSYILIAPMAKKLHQHLKEESNTEE